VRPVLATAAAAAVRVGPVPGRPEEGSWGGWSWARDWGVGLRGLRRLSSSSLSAGPILPVSCWAAFAWFCTRLLVQHLKEMGWSVGGYVFEDGPIEDIVVLKSFSDEKISEQFPQVRIIRFIIKPQTPRIIQKNGKLIRKPPTQNLCTRRHFLLHDSVIFLFLRSSFKSLPRQTSPTEIHHDVSE
jgi:hypothetical protein